MRTRHPTNTRPDGRRYLAPAPAAGIDPRSAPPCLPEPWSFATVQEWMEGSVFTRTYTALTVRREGLRAIAFRDSFEDPFFVTVSLPERQRQPVQTRLGFRSAGDPVSPHDLRLAWVVLRRGEAVGASFPILAQVHHFLRGLWVMA